MSQAIRFYHQGKLQLVDHAAPTQTVLQYLRQDVHCTGTKEGCAEGDCGACTVVIAELQAGQLALKAVNACIQFLPVLDGKALFSIEDLKQPDATLHPVQQALLECHASQCGFCTPGFAMSLWSLYLNKDAGSAAPSRQEIDSTLSGNLCRCTGYRPIIAAATRMFELPAIEFDRPALTRSLHALQRDDMLAYQQTGPAIGPTAGPTFYAPRTTQQLLEVYAAQPQACILSGSTDVGLWVTKQMRELGDIIYIGQIDELNTISEADGAIAIGAGVTLDDAYAAVCRHYPALNDMWQRFASLPIRSMGTLGGSVANGSPIGDSAPWLIALKAQIVLRSVSGTRSMALEAFYLDYMKKDLQPGEFVAALHIPLPQSNMQCRCYKLSKRFDQDISAVCAAFAITLDGNTVRDIRIVYGAMAATTRRASLTEAALIGQEWDEAALEPALALLAQDYAPLSDLRASSAYRMKTAQNLLRRFWLETRLEAPLAPQEVSVFAHSVSVA